MNTPYTPDSSPSFVTTVSTSSRAPRRVGLIIFAAVFVPLITTLGFLMPLVIWPGQMTLLAPLFCDDDQPDAFVVSDTYNVRPGETTTEFTLYCMGPNGDTTDKGYLWPFLITMGINLAVLLVLFIVLAIVVGIVRRGRRRKESGRLGPDGQPDDPEQLDPRLLGPSSTPGPFVD